MRENGELDQTIDLYLTVEGNELVENAPPADYWVEINFDEGVCDITTLN